MSGGSRRAASAEARVGWAFVAPQALGMLVFFLVPLGVSLYYTFTKWDLIAPRPTFVGWDNWAYLLQDERIARVLANTLRFVLFGTTGFLVLALLMALLLRSGRGGTGGYRALFILPFVLSAAGVGTIWRWVLNDRAGPIAQALDIFGIDSPQWLFDPKWAMIAIAIATTWQSLGFGMAILLAGLQDIPEHLYEAARLDGASRLQQFRYVTLPDLAPVLLFLTVTSLIAALQLYDPVVAMTVDGFGNTAAAGGPQDSTRTIVLYLYNQMFQYNEAISGLGYASTIAWFLALITIGFTAAQWLIFQSRNFRRKGNS